MQTCADLSLISDLADVNVLALGKLGQIWRIRTSPSNSPGSIKLLWKLSRNLHNIHFWAQQASTSASISQRLRSEYTGYGPTSLFASLFSLREVSTGRKESSQRWYDLTLLKSDLLFSQIPRCIFIVSRIIFVKEKHKNTAVEKKLEEKNRLFLACSSQLIVFDRFRFTDSRPIFFKLSLVERWIMD